MAYTWSVYFYIPILNIESPGLKDSQEPGEQMSWNSYLELIDYVNEFYGAGGLYQLPIENNDVGSLVNVKTRHVTRAEISHAIMIYFSILEYAKHKRYPYTYGGMIRLIEKESGTY